MVRLNDGSLGSVTIGGSVSPAGGNFDEPVTQATLKVVGAFHGLSRARSDARRYPAIDPLDSWSKYPSIVDAETIEFAREVLRRGSDVDQMMKVVGEEGTTIEDFMVYLKAEYVDAVYLQQDAFDAVDEATSADRQRVVFGVIADVLRADLSFPDKDEARKFFHQLTQITRDWNRVEMDTTEFKDLQARVRHQVSEAGSHA